MTTVNCPKCDEQVRMPADASAEARVQCPLCADEFELSEALDQLAPMLVVLHDPGRAYAVTSPLEKSYAEAEIDLAAESEDESESESESGTPEFSFEAPSPARAATPAFSFENGSATSGAAGSASSRRARSQRPQKSAVKEILKVVGGGVVGLTIGQLILWWLPGDLKKDPLELGPKIPAFASFLVSPKFRAGAVAKVGNPPASPGKTTGTTFPSFGGFADNGSSQLPSSSFDGLIDPNDVPASKKKKKKNSTPAKNSVATGTPALDASEADTGSGQADGVDGGADPLAPLVSEEDIFGPKPQLDVPMINLESFPTATEPAAPQKTPPGETGDTTPSGSPPAVEPTTPPDVPDTTPPPATTGDFATVRNAPVISPDELSSRLSGAVSASIAMDTAAEPMPKLNKEFYVTLAKLGEAITFFEQTSATNQFDEVGKFALEVGKQPAKLDLIGKAAPNWMKLTRPHNGLAVCGTVESIDFAAPYYVTSLVMPNKNVLKVVSIKDPAGDYQPQDKVLVLGSILESPQQDLKDYQGEEATVVLDGFHVRLPNAE